MLNGMPGFPHTLQLAILDLLNLEDVQNLLSKIDSAVKKLRPPSLQNVLLKINLKKAIL
jgi:hypothetical protein